MRDEKEAMDFKMKMEEDILFRSAVLLRVRNSYLIIIIVIIVMILDLCHLPFRNLVEQVEF